MLQDAIHMPQCGGSEDGCKIPVRRPLSLHSGLWAASCTNQYKSAGAVEILQEETPILRNVEEHFVRMEQVELDSQIILDPDGQLFDGAHRVAQRLALGKRQFRPSSCRSSPRPMKSSTRFTESSEFKILRNGYLQ